MSQDDVRAVAYVLVETGLHAGARLELRQPQTWYSAGGQVDADYWLADPDLAEAKAHFAVIDGGVRVRLSAGPAMVIGAASVELDAEAAFDKPLVWGGVTFRAVVMPEVSEAVQPAPAPKAGPANLTDALQVARGLAKNRRLTAAILALVAVVVPAAIALSLLGPIWERQRARELQREALSAQEDPRARHAQARAAAQRLGDLIGIQSVSVSAVDGKTLAVFGMNLPLERRDAVRAAISQFESEFTVRNHVSFQSVAATQAVQLSHLPEGIDLVHYGPQGYLRGEDGRLYLPGGVLPDGMQIDLIREGEVWLSRGTERAVLRAHALVH